MEDYTLVGNSIARGIQPEGFRSSISIPGAPLCSLLKVAEKTPGVTVILCGIPDICHKYHQHIYPRKVTNFKAEIDRYAASRTSGIVLPFYPPAYLSPSHYSTVQNLNDLITRTNRQRGESTPNILEKIFKPPANRLNHSALTDGVHPRRWYCREVERELGRWKDRRDANRRRRENHQARHKIQEDKRRQAELKEVQELEKKRKEIDIEI